MEGKAVRAQITEAQKIASGTGSEQDIAEAKIELEVCPPSTKMD
jgi:F-type H+-transporting ATPase subunit delta